MLGREVHNCPCCGSANVSINRNCIAPTCQQCGWSARMKNEYPPQVLLGWDMYRDTEKKFDDEYNEKLAKFKKLVPAERMDLWSKVYVASLELDMANKAISDFDVTFGPTKRKERNK